MGSSIDVESRTRARYNLSAETFYRKWHIGTPHSRKKKGNKPVHLLEDRDYTAKEIAAALGFNGRQVIAVYCRNHDLPHRRASDGRALLINGFEFRDWYNNPPVVSYPLAHRLKDMRIRCFSQQDKEIKYTHICAIEKVEPVESYELTLADGKKIVCTNDTAFYTTQGWKKFKELAKPEIYNGDKIAWNNEALAIGVNGQDAYKDKKWMKAQREKGLTYKEIAELCGIGRKQAEYWMSKHGLTAKREKYEGETWQDPVWLQEQRDNRRSAQEIADEFGVTLDRIKHQLRLHGIKITGGKGQYPHRKDEPWNKGLTYKNPKAGDANRGKPAKVTGKDHHWWRGGITSERRSIGQWAVNRAHEVHEKNDFKCVICKGGKNLKAHHIVPVVVDPSLGCVMENLTSLCHSCHMKVHMRHLEKEFEECHKNGTTEQFWELYPDTKNVRPEWKVQANPHSPLKVIKFIEIKDIKYLGEKEFYEVKIKDDADNIVVNGIIVQVSSNE